MSLVMQTCTRFLWLWVLAFHGCSGLKFGLVTFNTGLVPSNIIPHYQARKTAISSVLVNSSADVVCLQELWQQQDILDVAHTVRTQFPHYHSYDSTGLPGDTVSPSSSVCDAANYQLLQLCLFQQCQAESAQGIAAATTCAFANCRTQMDQLGQQCVNCLLFLDTTGASVAAALLLIQNQCVDNPTKNYATTHGLLLLSKYPLKDKQIHTYHPDIVVPITRGYIAAKIDGLGEVVCTHLTTEGAFPDYTGPPQFTSFGDLQKDEVQQLLQKFPATQNGYPPVILGDFNHGPKTDKLVPEHEANYQLIINSGFKSPYVTEVGNCTLCADNPLAGTTGSRKVDRVTDHIYVSRSINKTMVSGVKRMWDSMTAISATGGVNNSVIYLPLSDHFAVQLTYQASHTSSDGSVLSFALLVTMSVVMAVITLQSLL